MWLGMSFFLSRAEAAKVVSLHLRVAHAALRALFEINGSGGCLWLWVNRDRHIVSQLLKTEVAVPTPPLTHPQAPLAKFSNSLGGPWIH